MVTSEDPIASWIGGIQPTLDVIATIQAYGERIKNQLKPLEEQAAIIARAYEALTPPLESLGLDVSSLELENLGLSQLDGLGAFIEAERAIAARWASLSAQVSAWGEATLEHFPESWPRDRLADTFDLATGMGLPFVHCSVTAVVEELLSADQPRRSQILIGNKGEIVRSARAAINSVHLPELKDVLVGAAEALSAVEEGHERAAQALAAVLLATQLKILFGDTNLANARKNLDSDLEQVGMKDLRSELVVSLVSGSLANFGRGEDSVVPERFNRHATVHTISPVQYSGASALTAILLVVELMCETQNRGVMEFREWIESRSRSCTAG